MRFQAPSVIVIFTLVVGIAQASNNTVPVSTVGEWRVISVNPDQRTTISVNTKVNDPRYVGRTLIFSNDAVRGELDGYIDCQNPAYKPQPFMTLNAAIQKTSGAHNNEPKLPVAMDYGLKVSGQQKLTPYVFACQKGGVGPDGVVMKNWFAALSPETLIMNWDDNSYLVLQRVKDNEIMSPSYSCEGKLNAVEKTICGNNDLASWDQSVSSAFKTLIWQQQETDPNDKTTLTHIKSEQRAWIAKRNQCQTDRDCLKKVMQERVEQLVNEMQ